MKNCAPSAMAFYHPDGLVPAWKQAGLFAGPSGRVATLTDVIDARIRSPYQDPSWQLYFATASSEFYGLSKAGNPVLAVLHGSGPLSSAAGCVGAYEKDAEGRRRNGSIGRGTFLEILEGLHGDVHVVDWQSYVAAGERGRYLTADDAVSDPWACARFGGVNRLIAYAKAHCAMEEQRLAQAGLRHSSAQRAIFSNDSVSSVPYFDWRFSGLGASANARMPDDPEVVHANLLSLGGVVLTSRMDAPDSNGELTFDLSVHEWNDGTRLIGVRENWSGSVHAGLDLERARRERRETLLVEAEPVSGFDLVIKDGLEDWTAYPKQGTAMDSGEPMSYVTSCKELGQPVLFETEPAGYYGFFKYNVADVRRLAPQGANAYRLCSEVSYDGERNRQSVLVQFLVIEADRGQRLLRREEIYRDADLVLALAAA